MWHDDFIFFNFNPTQTNVKASKEQHLFNSKPHHWHNRLLKSNWMLCRAWQQLLFKTSCPTSKHSSKHTWKSTQVNKSPGGERKQNTKQLSTSKWIHTAKQIRVLLLAAEFPSGRCMCFELLKIPIFLPKILHGTCCQMPCLWWSSHKTHLSYWFRAGTLRKQPKKQVKKFDDYFSLK